MTDARLPAAGWYPDPSGAAQERWWNGVGWTEDVRALGTPPPYDPARPAPALRAPDGTSPWTPWIWILTLVPLIDVVTTLVQVLTPGYVDSVVTQTMNTGDQPLLPLDLIGYAFAMIAAATIIVCSWLDRRALIARGVPSPFPWAWSFFTLLGAPVYAIGRSIVVRRRTGIGIAPLVVAIVILVSNWAVSIATSVLLFEPLMEQFTL